MKRLARGAAVGVAFLAMSVLAKSALALTVLAGQTATLPGITASLRPELDGTVLASNSFTLLNSTTPGAYQAKLLFDVMQETSGTLEFRFQVVGSDVTTPLKWKVVVANLLFPVLDTDVRLDTPGIDAPIDVTVAPDGVATYSSDTPLLPGEQTHIFFIRAPGISGFKQGGTLELVTDFGSEPSPLGEGSPNGTFLTTGYTVIPEPQPLGLLALAIAGLWARTRVKT